MKQFCHGGNIYRETSPSGAWMDFSANINPLGIPDSVRAVILKHLDGIVHYPEPDSGKLRQLLSEHEGVPEESILLGNGAAELFYLFFYTLRPRRVLIPVPSFSEYERSARAAGAEVRFFPLLPEEDFAPDMERMEAAVSGADCLILGNPNNPTGQLLSKEKLEGLVKACEKQGCWLLVDESFLDFREDRAEFSLQDLVRQHEKLAVLRSLTKFYAIPGLRLGFGLMNPELRARMESGKDVWNVNLLAQHAGMAALTDDAYARKSRIILQEERTWLTGMLRELPLEKVYEPAVNFILVKCGTDTCARKVLFGMKSRGILLRDCSNYTGLETGGYLRMAIRSHEENQIVLQAWIDILREA